MEASPLEATLRRVNALSPRWHARIGWPESADWLAAAEIPDRLDELLALVAAAYETRDSAVVGTFFLNAYARTVVGAALASLVTERRVPDVGPPNLAVRVGPDGIAREVALARSRVALLPDDPAAGHPEAVVVPDVAALRRWLRERYIAHVTVLVEPLHARTRRGPRALWATASDMCSSVLAILAQVELQPTALDDEARAFLDHPPLLPTPAISGGWRRLTCCLAYRLPGYELCVSCPCAPSWLRSSL